MKTSSLELAALALGVSTVLCRPAIAQPPAAASPPSQKIVVESVTGSVRFSRDGKFQKLTRDSVLQQGDMIVAEIGGVCKLEFQHPNSGAVLAATILRGHTQMTVAQAYVEGTSARTQLDVPQGVIRAGVVRTGVPPSFQIRTPRTVVAVRGTEIYELNVSDDFGDLLAMGRAGVSLTNNGVPWFRSARAGQGTQQAAQGDARDLRLLRAIENALLEHRILLTGSQRRGMEVDFDRNSSDPFEFNPGEFMKGEGNPGRDRFVNSTQPAGPREGPCRICDTGNAIGNSGR